jgi:hypothetical protein
MSATTTLSPERRRTFLDYALLLLVVEKIVQHTVVSLAFYFNWTNIASSVVVQTTVLLVLGLIVIVLFCLALYGLLRHTGWSTSLILGLAIFDIIGEFIAQGTIVIDVTVSFLAAWLLLVLAALQKRRDSRTRPHDA